MSALELPHLDLASSPLLQQAVDDRFFNVWDYERGGRYAIRGEVKAEFDRLVAEILAHNSGASLIETALADRHLALGITWRGPDRYLPQRDGATVAAIRQLDLLVTSMRRRLFVESLQPPKPSDRSCASVPGLFERLSGRDYLLPVTRENVDVHSAGNDRLVLFGDHALFPHPHIRENRELVGDLLSLAYDGADVRLAIDPHAVVPREGRPQVGLYDYWFGIRLDRHSLDDPLRVGQVRHERTVDAHDRHVFPLLAIDVHWKRDGDRKILTVEETVPAETHYGVEGLVFNRCVHSERDWRRGTWTHLDGAVKAYRTQTYKPTRVEPGASRGEPTAYRKLWRIDGDISDEDWGRLVGHFFRENELVIECFGEILDERPGTSDAAGSTTPTGSVAALPPSR